MLALIKIRIQSVSKAIAGVVEDIHLSSVSFQYGDLTVTDVGKNSYKIGSINTQKPILREEDPLTPKLCKSDEKVLNVISPIIIDRGGLRASVGDVKQLANYDALLRNNIVASINDVISRLKPLEPTMPTIHVTDFTLADCDAAIANGENIQIASQQIWDAAAANKIIFIPRGDTGGGCVALSSISDDYVYLTCIDNYIGLVYNIEVTPDGVGFVNTKQWSFHLMTINGQSIFGSGDIVIEEGTAANGVYIADFYMHQLWGGEYIPFDIQALQEAIEANKIIYIPYDENDGTQGGCVATALIDDMIYLTIFGDLGNVYLVEIDFGSTDIDPQRIIKHPAIRKVNGVDVTSSEVIVRPIQNKVALSSGKTLALTAHRYFSVQQPLNGLVQFSLPTSVTVENNVQQCGVTFTTGTSLTVNYLGGTILWEGGAAPTIEGNAVVELIFTWHWEQSAWLGRCRTYKA